MAFITANNLGKAYKRYPNRWGRLIEWFMPGAKPRHNLIWILQHINFHVKSGEAVGIIGVNGAGKSTLLKMITGTTQPTDGSVHTSGRVAALLELGMGFHPEFTGRQNVVMAAQLMAHNMIDIRRLMPDIISFAEIGDYIDLPVRVYSSGMQVRLAFSVATASRPDILVVDEALAVGDVYFQQKCYRRIRNFIDSGTILFFVSHGMSTVLELCTRCIYLRDGRAVFDGIPKEAVDLYQADQLLQTDQAEAKPSVINHEACMQNPHSFPEDNLSQEHTAIKGGPGSLLTDAVSCTSVRFVNDNEKPVTALLSEERARLEICYRILRDLDDPAVGFKIRDRFGTVVFETNTYCMGETIGKVNTGIGLVTVFYFPIDFVAGDFTVTVGMGNRGYAEGLFEESISYLHDVLMFTVLPNPDSITWAGVVNIHPQVNWATREFCGNSDTPNVQDSI